MKNLKFVFGKIFLLFFLKINFVLAEAPIVENIFGAKDFSTLTIVFDEGVYDKNGENLKINNFWLNQELRGVTKVFHKEGAQTAVLLLSKPFFDYNSFGTMRLMNGIKNSNNENVESEYITIKSSQVVITEIMANGSDMEWIEIENVTENILENLYLKINDGEKNLVISDITINSGDVFVICESNEGDGKFADFCDYELGGAIDLADEGEEIYITDGNFNILNVVKNYAVEKENPNSSVFLMPGTGIWTESNSLKTFVNENNETISIFGTPGQSTSRLKYIDYEFDSIYSTDTETSFLLEFNNKIKRADKEEFYELACDSLKLFKNNNLIDNCDDYNYPKYFISTIYGVNGILKYIQVRIFEKVIGYDYRLQIPAGVVKDDFGNFNEAIEIDLLAWAGEFENLIISGGSAESTVKVETNIDNDNHLEYEIKNNPQPNLEMELFLNKTSYNSGDDISIIEGKYLCIYELNSDNKLQRFFQKQITAEDFLVKSATETHTFSPGWHLFSLPGKFFNE